MSTLHKALEILRNKANNDTELGKSFEKLCKIFFENDATQTQQYSKIWHYTDWAKENIEYSKVDIGIDLVAKLRNEDGFCAIQCKFYKSDHSISKSDLDSFISASSTPDFKRLVLIDTSAQLINRHAQTVFNNLNKEYMRIQLEELQESRIDWLTYINDGVVYLNAKNQLYDHQIEALQKVKSGFSNHDRGKMIMACGTGKTFTSLRIAEDIAGPGKIVLYMVPSLALMSQTIREWKKDSILDFIAFAACSDEKVGKKKQSDDQIDVQLTDLALPATTDPIKISDKILNLDRSNMIVVFSTYHSIDVISKAQFQYGLDEFDLIICDEAHRTTGATLSGDDESNFVKIHSNENIKGKKRLYMTATPRIYGETARKKEDEGLVNLASMDDEEIFGKTFIHRSFGWAVENNHLTDYKVVVLMMDEKVVSEKINQNFVKDKELDLDDVTKMIGCYKSLGKVGLSNKSKENELEIVPMKKALAFCQNIALSKSFALEFSNVVREYTSNENIPENESNNLEVELFHVDGTFNAEQRNERLNWLKDDTDKDICRVLSNAKCLSEGVDVPALDAIMFLHPRKSQIDVVQSVGRVMRKSEGKKLGYVILPIAVAPGISPENALNDNKRYQVVWQILNALRAHDERFDNTINRIGLGEDVSDKIEIVETTAIIEDIDKRSKSKENEDVSIDETKKNEKVNQEEDNQLSFTLTDLSQAIKAKIVEKCGTRDYWETWANDIAKIAKQYIDQINSIVINSNTPERDWFLKFLEEVRDDINKEISESDAIEMLAQHIITRPVFDALFQGNEFASQNLVSKAMEKVLSQINIDDVKTKSHKLKNFYDSVKRRADGIITSQGRQTLVLELYDRFFKNAFPDTAKKLGIVHTPIPIVDFIINSTEEIMKDQFGKSLSDKNVNILDPFAGTGTFVSRLIQSEIINEDKIKYKYNTEIHANEIVLLAYYIACINIESAFLEKTKGKIYNPYKGMVLTDTFQLYEVKKDEISDLLPDNSKRRTDQLDTKIRVVLGNPPYSVHSRTKYKKLDNEYKKNIIDLSKAKHKSSLYDPFYKSIFWAANQIEQNGIISFVVNNSWIETSIADSFRQYLTKKFSSIFLVDLKGDIRKARFDKDNKQEGGNVFGNKSQNGIVLMILVKNSIKENEKKISYVNLGDNLKTDQKLAKLSNFNSLGKLLSVNKTKVIKPNADGDWINPRIKVNEKVFRLGDKANPEKSIFLSYTSGVKTNRDEWAINFSKNHLIKNMEKMITNYKKIIDSNRLFKKSKTDFKNIKWDGTLESAFSKKKYAPFNEEQIIKTSLRPFVDSHVYFSELYNNSIYLNNLFFPSGEKNNAVGIPGLGSRSNFSPLGVKFLPNYDFFDKTQFFPRYKFLSSNKTSQIDGNYFSKHKLERISNINPNALKTFKIVYSDNTLTDDDLFYFTYSLLNSKKYLDFYKTIIGREMPPIPFPSMNINVKDFCLIGKDLFNLHTNWNNSPEYQENELFERKVNIKSSYDLIQNIKLVKKTENIELSAGRIIVISGIPLNVLDLKYNGTSPLEWVLKRSKPRSYKISGNLDNLSLFYKESGLDPNQEFVKYLRKIIYVSLETLSLIKKLNNINLHLTN